MIIDVDSWQRVGAGKDFQFFATDDDIQEWLTSALPDAYAPYSIVGYSRLRQASGRYSDLTFSIPVFRFASCYKTYYNAGFFLSSDGISDGIQSVDRGERVDTERFYAANGLISVDPGFVDQEGARHECAIGLTHQVENVHTGEIRVYDDYDRVFEELRKAIRRDLVFSTRFHRNDGTCDEYTDWPLMTERAAQAAVGGHVLFAAQPGRRVGDARGARS